MGEGEDRRARTTIVTPPTRAVKALLSTPLISREEEGKKKIGISICLQPAISTSLALSSFRLFSQISRISPPQRPLPCSVFLCSPFTAGLGYSFRRQAHSVSLLLQVTERRRESQRERERKAWGEKNVKKREREKKKRKQSGVTAMQKNFKMKEGGNKRVEGEGRKKILEEHQSRGEVQRSWHTYDSLFHSLRPSPPLNIFSFRSFFPPLPPFSLSSLPPFLFYYL